KKGESGQPKEGEGQKPGEQGPEGKEGEKGKTGENGKAGENGKSGKNGKNGEGNGNGEGKGSGTDGLDGFNEDLNGELYKIYQQQQMIREALEQRLEKEGLRGNGDARQLLKDMEDVELDLINKGFTNQTLSKMMNLQHQLLKLENATFQQGQDIKRKADTNIKDFNNTTTNQLPKAKEYFNTIEILNKQTLPLQPVYKEKVQDYFKQKIN
ncbi:MAG: collagen-like protein, partial [Bizionia sp.]|nr:collagen-like protein [Bizionia sp.]